MQCFIFDSPKVILRRMKSLMYGRKKSKVKLIIDAVLWDDDVGLNFCHVYLCHDQCVQKTVQHFFILLISVFYF